MKREEAIKRIQQDLDVNKKYLSKEYKEALNMAIEALQTEAVRCNDCKHQEHCYETVAHTRLHDGFKEHWSESIEWCSRGERKGGDEE